MTAVTANRDKPSVRDSSRLNYFFFTKIKFEMYILRAELT